MPSDTSTDTPSKTMHDTADAAARESRRAAGAAKKTMGDARAGVARTVSDAAEMAHAEADARLQSATSGAADQTARTARAANDAASDYPDGSVPHEALMRVSGFLEDTAKGLRDTDLDQVTSDVRAFARRNPVMFFAGAAAVGFAAARLLRASAPDLDDAEDYDAPTEAGWTGETGAQASAPTPRTAQTTSPKNGGGRA